MQHSYSDAWGSAQNLWSKALYGKRSKLVAPGHVSWDLSGFCKDPKIVIKKARAQLSEGAAHTWCRIDLATRCRGCKWCLVQRRHMWAGRARGEYTLAESRNVTTWLGTLTFRPEQRYVIRCEAEQMFNEQDKWGASFDWLTPAEQLVWLAKAAGVYVTNYLKRVRNYPRDQWRATVRKWAEENGLSTRGKVVREMVAAGLFGPEPEAYKFRYMLVAEPHETSGFPHFHFVMHDLDGHVLHAALSEKWDHGFTRFKAVYDGRGAEYAAKYLAKARLGRVRASRGYGTFPSDVTRPQAIGREAVRASEMGSVVQRNGDGPPASRHPPIPPNKRELLKSSIDLCRLNNRVRFDA